MERRERRTTPLSLTDPAAAGGDSDATSRVSVAVRIRPLRQDLPSERYDTCCLYCTTPDLHTLGQDAPTTVTIIHPTTKEQTDFGFDRVFDDNDSQTAVYAELVEDHVLSTVERNGDLTVMAYGQTGSGKTYTMLGERASGTASCTTDASGWLSPESGVFLRAMNTLLAYRSLHQDRAHVLIFLHAVEIYNDTFIDLLGGSNTNRQLQGMNAASVPNSFLSRLSLAATTSSSSNQPGTPLSPGNSVDVREYGENMFLLNVMRVPLDTLEAVQKCFDITHKNRSVSATNMNDVSSRSHAIFQIDFVIQRKEAGNAQPPDLEAILEFQHWSLMQQGSSSTAAVTASAQLFSRTHSEFSTTSATLQALQQWENKNPSNNFERYPLEMSRITLVDLAGSERVKRSGVVGKEMQEAVFVNSSLSTLGLVVHSLCSRQTNASKHIPFRDSKMTRLLRPAFVSPHAKVVFITNLSPTSQSYAETLNSMRFAARLKELKITSPPMMNSGPSLGMLLSDERLQRLRLQMDEMAADLRIHHATTPGVHAATAGSIRLPRLRRTLTEMLRANGCDTLGAHTLCRAQCVREGMQRAKEDAAKAQEVVDAERRAIEEEVRQQAVAAAKQCGRLNEDETTLTRQHLEDSLKQLEHTLQFTRSTCKADVAQWQAKTEAENTKGDVIGHAVSELTKRKRDLFHASVHCKAETDELQEELALVDQSIQFDSAKLTAERSELTESIYFADLVEQATNGLMAYWELKHNNLEAKTSLRRYAHLLQNEATKNTDIVVHKLEEHEKTPEFLHRLSTFPMSAVLDSSIVRTSVGRHLLLDDRLEQSASTFTVSPMSFYFTPEIAAVPVRYVPWERESSYRRAASNRSRGGGAGGGGETENYSDDELEDDDVEAACQVLREASLRSANGDDRETCSTTITSAITTSHRDPIPPLQSATGREEGRRPLHRRLELSREVAIQKSVQYYLQMVSLYGHLMRVMMKAERRRQRSASSPLLTSAEVRAIFVILDAVEIDPRVVEAVVHHSVRQLMPSLPSQADVSSMASPTLAASRSEKALLSMSTDGKEERSPALPKATVCRMSSYVLHALTSCASKKRTQHLQASGGRVTFEDEDTAGTSSSELDFFPCLIRSLQALTLTSLYDDFFELHALPEWEGEEQETIAEGVAIELTRMQGAAESLGEAEQAIFRGCQFACRASSGSSGGDWSVDDLRTHRGRRHGAATAVSALARDVPQDVMVPFLWSVKRRDLSLLRGLTSRCLIASRLLHEANRQKDTEGDDGSPALILDEDLSTPLDQHVPTPSRFLECIVLVLRSMSASC